MTLLIVSFSVFVALALCVYRVAFGPQKQLAGLGLGLGAVAASLCGLAYPDDTSALLMAGYVAGALMLLVVLALVVTSVRHWLHTPETAE